MRAMSMLSACVPTGGGHLGAGEKSQTDPRLLSALRGFDAFRGLSRRAFADVARMVRLRAVKRGEVLFSRGEPSGTLFLVATGRFFVFLDPAADPVAEIGAGEPVGDLAFLTGRPRTATVIAARDSEVMEVSRSSYQTLFERVPLLQQGLLTRLAERMQAMAPTAQPLARSPARTIALCPTGSAPIPDGLVQGLAAALSRHGRTGIVEADPLAHDGEAPEDLLGSLERDCRFVLCPLAPQNPDGEGNAGRLLRHCDSVILVGRLADDPRSGCDRLERACTELFLKRNRTLLLWRETVHAPITGTPAWLEAHCVELHHHVALDTAGDIERIARFAAGRALGAVFGGSGALGCGHLGLVRAFRDAGVEFDLFGGTSAGAAMAMALATGHSPEDAMDKIEEIFVQKRAMRRFTVPVFSLLDHTVFDRELDAAYAGCEIADLPINAYAVSTNLTRSSLHVHRSGPVWQAVRSSGAIPGALPPFVTDNGELLVDGALVDNLPVSVMRGLKIGPNVLAGFFEDESQHRAVSYESVPGRERLIADIVLRRKRMFPGLLDVLSRAMLVTSRRSLRETEIGSDLLVHLPTRERMGLLEWRSGRAQEELCYRYVTDLIEDAGGPDALIAQGAGPH